MQQRRFWGEAVTIYYIKPKFRQIELTAGDLKKIAAKTKPKSHKDR